LSTLPAIEFSDDDDDDVYISANNNNNNNNNHQNKRRNNNNNNNNSNNNCVGKITDGNKLQLIPIVSQSVLNTELSDSSLFRAYYVPYFSRKRNIYKNYTLYAITTINHCNNVYT
jgi:hypothetical protein